MRSCDTWKVMPMSSVGDAVDDDESARLAVVAERQSNSNQSSATRPSRLIQSSNFKLAIPSDFTLRTPLLFSSNTN